MLVHSDAVIGDTDTNFTTFFLVSSYREHTSFLIAKLLCYRSGGIAHNIHKYLIELTRIAKDLWYRPQIYDNRNIGQRVVENN